MILYFRSALPLIRLLPVLLLTSIQMPVGHAAEEPPAVADHSDERAVLEIDLARFYSLIMQDPDPSVKTTLLGYQREFSTRANNLLKNFDSVRYDELRYDINLQCQRLARKLAPLNTPPLPAAGESVPTLLIANLNPSPTDPADVKAALEAADGVIKRLEARAGTMIIGSAERNAEIARIKQIKEQRAILAKDFTKARWDALAGELSNK